MKKKSVSLFFEHVPDVIANMTDWVKSYVGTNAKDLVGNAGGSLGLIVRLLARPLIEHYDELRSQRRLENYGQNTYLAAANKQALSSLEHIGEQLPDADASLFASEVNDALARTVNFSEIYPVFQPLYHPLVAAVKRLYVELLTNLHCEETAIEAFVKNFNEEIGPCVEAQFGDDYPKHLQEIQMYHYEQNELRLLFDTVSLEKIGFEKTESLKYETTYAEWKKVSEFGEFETDEREEVSQRHEDALIPISTLIETYFDDKEQDNVDKILFVVADFGKGKSVFLKHYASQLARAYLKTKEGYFPVYFNLRNYGKENLDTRLGVISDYLLGRYAINIESPYFAQKKYCFLIDSLDESGELNHFSIGKVVSSVKKIQNLDKTRYRTNRIIITSRPFNDGLKEQLTGYSPYCRKNKEGRDEEYFISLYGFKRDQFNDWLLSALKQANRKKFDTDVRFVSRIFKAIDAHRNVDIYKDLLSNKTLKTSELRRPIFAYMIYQLILNNVDILEIGKIGIYLSFLNLLTKDAKHIKDPNYKVSLQKEFEYRNLLHATAALWMYRRHSGKQGFLSKADLCRVLDGSKSGEDDYQVLDRYKNRGVIEIEFLSHSYFGENDNTLHFQHQSFAEILLAEYYLKIFLKYALDDQPDIMEVKSRLALGAPTEQTILFLIDLLHLVKMVSTESSDKKVLELRKLLFPLCASVSTRKNNKLFSNELYYEWFKNGNFSGNTTDYPVQLLENWCLGEAHIDKILQLCRNILTSDGTMIISRAQIQTVLFDNEAVLVDSPLSVENVNIDKWLALLVGNTLCNDTTDSDNPRLFNTEYKIPYKILFDLLTFDNSFSRLNSDMWRRQLFMGIRMDDVQVRVSDADRVFHDYQIRLFTVLNFVDFSYSHFVSVDFSGCLCGHTNFSFCSFRHVSFSHCYFWHPMFKEVEKLDCIFYYCMVSGIKIEDLRMNNGLRYIAYVPRADFELDDLLAFIEQLHAYYSKQGADYISWIKSKIRFSSTKAKTRFMEALNRIENPAQGVKRAVKAVSSRVCLKAEKSE